MQNNGSYTGDDFDAAEKIMAAYTEDAWQLIAFSLNAAQKKYAGELQIYFVL